MAWRETPRAQASLIRRTYRCPDCTYEFRWTHASADEPFPDCPRCEAARSLAPNKAPAIAPVGVAYVPPLPGILGTKSKAIDYTQRMAEEDYGLTDFNDNQRAGDIAFKPPAPMHTAEREAVARELIQAGVSQPMTDEMHKAADNFWSGPMGGQVAESSNVTNSGVTGAAMAQAKAEGVEPIGLLEKARTAGSMAPHYSVVAAAEMPTQP